MDRKHKPAGGRLGLRFRSIPASRRAQRGGNRAPRRARRARRALREKPSARSPVQTPFLSFSYPLLTSGCHGLLDHLATCGLTGAAAQSFLITAMTVAAVAAKRSVSATA